MAGLHRFQIQFNGTLHDFRAVRHPSESGERFVARVLARVLHHEEGLTFSRGVCHGDQPALFTPGEAGRLKTWIDIGCPSEKKLRVALRTADRLILYSYGSPAPLRKVLSRCPRGRVEVWGVERGFLRELAALVTASTLGWLLTLDGERLQVTGVLGRRWQWVLP